MISDSRATMRSLLAAVIVFGSGITNVTGADRNSVTPEMATYFSTPNSDSTTPDHDGFIGRWLMLEPIDKPNRSNTVFTDSYLKEVFNTYYFPGQFSDLPWPGKKEKVGRQTLKWHSLDSNLFNVKLFRFATGLDKSYYGVLFWVFTAIDCEEDIPDVRLSVGSNSASMWWIDGQETLLLSGDRRMVKDDCMSKRLTLKKGRNIISGAIINGPGMSDFCLRFLYEDGKPVTNFTICNL